MDWWNVYAEHTPFEWKCQKALYEIEPWGERRDDIRKGWHEARQLGIPEGDDERLEIMASVLASYLKVHRPKLPESTSGDVWGTIRASMGAK